MCAKVALFTLNNTGWLWLKINVTNPAIIALILRMNPSISYYQGISFSVKALNFLQETIVEYLTVLIVFAHLYHHQKNYFETSTNDE